jgi:hypothetical protein
VKNTNIQTPSKAKPNKKPVFGDPALELVYRSWQRNRETAPELALKVVEAYAQAHRLSVRDLLRRFAEAEAREASQVPQAAPEAHGGLSGEGAGTAPPPLASEAATALQRPEEGFLASHVQDAILAVQQSIGDPLGVDTSGLLLGGDLRYPAPGLQGLEETRYPVDCCTPPPPARSRLQDWVSWGRDLVENTLEEARQSGDAERAAALEELLALLEGKGLEAGPVKLLLLLAYLGRRYLRERFGPQASRKASQVAFHLPNDLLAAYIGVDRVTVWRWMEVLKAAGLADSREHRAWAVIKGQPHFYTTGNVWLVRLKPGKVRWTYEDLAHPWRDLEEDRASGRTAYRVLWPQGKGKGKNRKKPIRPSLELLVRWTLGIREAPPPEVLLTRRDPTDIAEIFALTDLDPQERPDAIRELAERMAANLADPHSVRLYMRVLWRVVEGKVPATAVYNAYRAAYAPIRHRLHGEGPGQVRRPGALFAAILLQVPGVREALRDQAA